MSIPIQGVLPPSEEMLIPIQEEPLILVQEIILPPEEVLDFLPEEMLIPVQEILLPSEEALRFPPEEMLIPVQEIILPPETMLIPVQEILLPPEEILVPLDEIPFPPEELIIPMPVLDNRRPLLGSSEDDWVMVAANNIDDFVSSITVRSNDFAYPEYILLFNSVVVPYVEPFPLGEGWVHTPFEDYWEIVTLHRVDEMMTIIKVETLIFSSVYHFYCN
jgi:hypothetical protein